MKIKEIAAIMLISLATVTGAAWSYRHLETGRPMGNRSGDIYPFLGIFAGHYGKQDTLANSTGFNAAVSKALPATVRVLSKVGSGRTFGSGVIISEDGYIITNRHVIEGGRGITVTLSNQHVLPATLAGSDPSTDLALLKVDARELPILLYGNSDEVKVGQWVLAIGSPLRLETTVTAGIISARGRVLHIEGSMEQAPPIPFLQTDAATNFGNSGGPLVDVQGRLIGINTALASPTGSYTGYSFAIPVNMVKRVVKDILSAPAGSPVLFPHGISPGQQLDRSRPGSPLQSYRQIGNSTRKNIGKASL